jgi:predicted RNA-binding Zn ribbon-like protein
MTPYPPAALPMPPFDLSGGHPALDLVNSLDDRFHPQGPTELLEDYGDVLRFVEQNGLLDAGTVRALSKSATASGAARTLHRVRALREELAGVLYGVMDELQPGAAGLRRLQGYFIDAATHRELVWAPARAEQRQGPLRWAWGRHGRDVALPLWVLAQAAAELMLSGAMRHVRSCGSNTCRWLFLDTSKNHSRRWCNMKVCGNRMKARRFQQRHAPGS